MKTIAGITTATASKNAVKVHAYRFPNKRTVCGAVIFDTSNADYVANRKVNCETCERQVQRWIAREMLKPKRI